MSIEIFISTLFSPFLNAAVLFIGFLACCFGEKQNSLLPLVNAPLNYLSQIKNE